MYHVCDFAICDIGMKIAFRSGLKMEKLSVSGVSFVF